MSVNKMIIVALLGMCGALGPMTIVRAEETNGAKIEKAQRDVKRGAKRTVRDIQDKTCETVNGKVECAVKRAGHGVQNAADEVKDKAKD